MAYSDLIVTPEVSVTDVCGGATATDDTGMYPASEGGFAETGEGTATRPDQTQVQVWFIYRRRNSDGTWTTVIPDEQPFTWEDPQFPIPLLDEEGEPFADAGWQLVEIVAPVADSWATIIEGGLTFDEIVELYEADGAVGQTSFFPNCTTSACLNNANTMANNTLLSGGCQCGDYDRKTILMQGSVSNLAIADALSLTQSPISDGVTARYQKASVCIADLLRQCALNSCTCGC